MRYMICRVRDHDARVIIDLQKVVSVEEYKPEGGTLRSYTRLYLSDNREYMLAHTFDEIHKNLQGLEHGL